jgi:transcriptional regulator with XRE-family HTH domain
LPVASLGERVRAYREAQEYSLSDLAKKSGVSRSYLYQVESGASSPTEEKLLALATALGVTVTDLLGIDATPPAVPDALATFAQEANLPSGDVEMLARINFRGKQPTTSEGWRALYLMIKTMSEEM